VRKKAFVRPWKAADKEMESEMLASLVALRKAMQKYPIRHAVSFHGSIRKAEQFAEQNQAFNKTFRSFGHVDSFHVSGATATGTRSKLIKEFAGKDRALITNARCLTEGVDVPDIDCVLFADPRRSAVDIVQAVGRALRPSPGKKMGYVIVPILHDAKAKPEKILESEDFQEILSTLRALASNDDRIMEYFRASANGKKRPRGGSVTFDIDERIAKKIDLDQFIKDIDLKCWHRLAKLSWRPFEEAREFVRVLGLKNTDAWIAYTQGNLSKLGHLPSDIPAKPRRSYADQGWINMGDWLGTNNVANFLKEYRQFSQARSFVIKLGLKNNLEWRSYCKGGMPEKCRLPKDIPANPNSTYAGKGWKGFGHWLGTGTVAAGLKRFRDFKEARTYVRKLKLKNQSEWFLFCKSRRPKDIPVRPDQTPDYAKYWKGFGDWLGTGNIADFKRDFRSFNDARNFARSLNLKSTDQWRSFCKKEMTEKGTLPLDIPACPNTTYNNKGWISWGDWLGTGNVANQLRKFRSFEKSRSFVHCLKLKNQHEWRSFCKGRFPEKGMLPSDIPAHPYGFYKGSGWISWGDWLGKGNDPGGQRGTRRSKGV